MRTCWRGWRVALFDALWASGRVCGFAWRKRTQTGVRQIKADREGDVFATMLGWRERKKERRRFEC